MMVIYLQDLLQRSKNRRGLLHSCLAHGLPMGIWLAAMGNKMGLWYDPAGVSLCLLELNADSLKIGCSPENIKHH